MNPRDFSFPLNVYAALLQWAEGRAEHLHYGLFERPDEPIAQAQERGSERLWAQIPPAPCRVLEVGIGLGTTLRRLHERGYAAHGITPDRAQIAAVEQSAPAALSIEAVRLEDLGTERGPWDLMLFQESTQYIDPLALFEAAQRLLEPGRATLLVMDEFALKRESDADHGLHLLSHFCALAARFGWRQAHEEDLSAAARITPDVLLELSARYRHRLIDELGVTAEQVDTLDESNRRYRSAYARGVFGYRLLRFERDAAPQHHPVTVVPARSAQMRALFARVFGREMSQQEWAWKYRQGHGVGRLRGDTLDAFYGGLSRRLSMRGQPMLGCQICDVMVAPEANGSLARRGALHEVTTSFLEQQIGWGRPHAVGFGFPNLRALQVAERLGLYRRVDRMVQIDWRASERLGVAENLAVDFFAASEFDQQQAKWPVIDQLWLEMAAAFGESVLGVRDAQWVQYRYGLKPDATHHIVVLRKAGGGSTLGAAVVRPHDQMLELLDVISAPRHWPDLVDAVCQHARTLGLPLVWAWVTASHAHHLLRKDEHADQRDLNMHVPANAHTAGIPPSALEGRWLLMGGDTDFR